jgi:hypothetical protein
MTNGATTTFTQGNTAAQICQEALAGNTLPTRWQSKCSPDVAALATMDCGKAHEALEADKAVVSLRRARRQEQFGMARLWWKTGPAVTKHQPWRQRNLLWRHCLASHTAQSTSRVTSMQNRVGIGLLNDYWSRNHGCCFTSSIFKLKRVSHRQ